MQLRLCDFVTRGARAGARLRPHCRVAASYTTNRRHAHARRVERQEHNPSRLERTSPVSCLIAARSRVHSPRCPPASTHALSVRRRLVLRRHAGRRCQALRQGCGRALQHGYGYGYGYFLGPIPVPPIYLAGSFGPVLPPGWLDYTRSSAVPQNVEGYTRPPRSAQSPLRLSRACSPHARRE